MAWVTAMRARMRALLMVGPLVALSWAAAHAAFTDTVEATTSFSTGTIDIQADDQDGTVAFTSLSTRGMTPGDVVYAPLKISNAGSVDFDYTMSAATTGSAPLAAALAIGVKVVPSATCDAGAYSASSTVAVPEVTGLDNAAIAARALAASAAEYVCFRVELPSGANNGLQGLTTNATFTFTATAS